MSAQPKIQNNNGCTCQYEVGNGHSFVCPLYEKKEVSNCCGAEFSLQNSIGAYETGFKFCSDCGDPFRLPAPQLEKECKWGGCKGIGCDVCKPEKEEDNQDFLWKTPLLEILNKHFPKGKCKERGAALLMFAESVLFFKKFIPSAIAKERDSFEKELAKKYDMDELEEIRSEEREEIVKMLEGMKKENRFLRPIGFNAYNQALNDIISKIKNGK